MTMLGAMKRRGGEQRDTWSTDSIAIGVAASEWESEATGTGVPRVERLGACMVTADATLYYRDDLRRRLAGAGFESRGESPGALILSAYQAFGRACVDHLEGDFAFVLWDGDRRILVAARDFAGRRSLYFATPGGELILASTVGGVLGDGRVREETNLATLATVAAALWVNTDRTAIQGVSELRAGHVLTWDGRSLETSRFWHPPAALSPEDRHSDAATSELRSLLSAAVAERLAPSGPTAVSLSGGWDSTAVFASGANELQGTNDAARSLIPVSITYPEGDPGREDDLIRAVTSRWNTSSEWIDVDSIQMFADVQTAARQREEPWAHPYEQWNRALSRTARRRGARVILDGVGGDSLFQVSGVFLSDLVRTGRLVEVARQWRAGGGKGVREFLRVAVRPALPARVLSILAAVRGMSSSAHYLERRPSPWIRTAFLREHGVFEAEAGATPPLPHSSAVLAETHAYLLYPAFPRLVSRLSGFAVEEGVELRSPLLDARVVRFAAARPWRDRVDQRETKVLLRRSMRGLLPDEVLAPRTHRTGVTSGYFVRSLRGPGRPVLEPLMENSRLASLGIINPATLQRAWEYFLRTGDDDVGVRIYFTLQCELWLRTHA